MKYARIRACLWAAISIALFSVNAVAQDRKPIKIDKARVIQHWTKERRANAIPRDLVIDARGLGYLKRPDGTLQPHGHDVPARITPTNETISPFAARSSNRGGGSKSSDKTPPTISNMDPAEGTIIGYEYTFEARVADTSGVKSVTFKVQRVGSNYVNSIPTTKAFLSNMWGVNLNGFTNGDWIWWVEAKDRAGNIGSSPVVNFKVYTGSANVPVSDEIWDGGDIVKMAAGRLYFEMPTDPNHSTWRGYVCSATVVNDEGTADRSLIITAAHCAYDDANRAFARNVMFIPDQAESTSTTGDPPRTDLDCSNDPLGCWVPSFGVVDEKWADPTKTFPDKTGWDYAFYVVPDSGAHDGAALPTEALDKEAGSLQLSFAVPNYEVANSDVDFTYALGYPYSQDPEFRYCTDELRREPYNPNTNWWLGGCELSGGSSGGPWVQPMDKDAGDGKIISVNSYYYVSNNGTKQPGMAGPKLYDGVSTASCVFEKAKTATVSGSPGDGDVGVAVSCP